MRLSKIVNATSVRHAVAELLLIVEYRLTVISGNQIGFYTRAIEDIRKTLEMLDDELPAR